jgi:murein DD-endopeptidase MepM/ murein hydrolase activator NlpD
MLRARALFLVLVAALVCGLVAPVGAAGSTDPRAQRDRARARKAQLASELNTIKASERQLLAAAAVLDDQVLAQAARVDAARQAVAAAEAELRESTTSLTETKSLITNLQTQFVDRAVSEFISPRGQKLNDLIESDDLAATARKNALLDTVAANDKDLLDQLGAAREDYEAARAAAAAASERAKTRRADTESQLSTLERDRARQHKIQAALTARQKEVLGEIDAQAAAEATLTRIIKQHEAASSGDKSAVSGRVGRGGCAWPVSGHVTSEYGYRWGRLHAGIDIGAPTGTPIHASAPGTVIFAGQQNGYGNVIIIDHGGGFSTLYAHQSRLAARDGQTLPRGGLVGYVGSTGHSTGPHLHFETRYGGSPRNPRLCLP